MGPSHSPKRHAMDYPLLPAGGLTGTSQQHPSMNMISASLNKNMMALHVLVVYMVTLLHQPGLSF
eukprot:1018163-Karenia_brevis.AAC.1